MNTYQVELTKSYLITISADSEERALEYAEYYTSDISDISTEIERNTHNFQIEEIECSLNEASNCELLDND